MDRVGKRALELLGDGLLDGLRDDRSFAAILSMCLAASSGAGVVNLEMLANVVVEHTDDANLVGEALLKTLGRLLLNGVGDLGSAGGV